MPSLAAPYRTGTAECVPVLTKFRLVRSRNRGALASSVPSNMVLHPRREPRRRCVLTDGQTEHAPDNGLEALARAVRLDARPVGRGNAPPCSSVWQS
eukprot:SAG31_NODE_4932_length_2854_cov_5.855898_4_plen_97_part_00